MDMFDWSSVVELMKIEPGHGLVQSVLLFMIWIQSRGVRLAIKKLEEALSSDKASNEIRFQKIENRLTIVEGMK